MGDTAIWTAVLTGAAAISGVLVTVIADGLKDRRRVAHERKAREEERRTSAEARRRTFELENLITAYDGLWLLARESSKVHAVDRRAAQAGHGYGGTRLPEGVEADIVQTSQAVKAIRLILNDEVRRLALDAQSAMNDLSMLGVKAKIFDAEPVSLERGDAMSVVAVRKTDTAMNAIADRIRVLVAEQ